MPINPPSAAEMNKTAARFWSEHAEIFTRQCADPILFRHAVKRVKNEILRGVPTYSQLTLEQALDDAEEARREDRSQVARTGGRALKGDPLQALIEDWVRRNPELTLSQLLSRLQDHCPLFPIEEVAEEEITIKLAGSDRVKSVPISGLKDRLSRAKKKVRSRKAASAN